MHRFIKPVAGLVYVLLFLALCGCTAKEQARPSDRKLQVVATLFPLFDMARAIGGEYAEVSLLLPPGAEAHSFEPRPGDILRLNGSDIFIYTGPVMEPWAESLLKGVDAGRLLSVNTSIGIQLLQQAEEPEHGRKHEHQGGGDPHVWLDFTNARTMAATILTAFETKAPAHAAVFRRNAAAYQARLEELDRAYRVGLTACNTKTVIHAGHFAFGYMAKRYGLRYLSAFPSTGDSEPNARQMASMVELIRSTGSTAIFSEELVSPRLANILGQEAGARLLPLNAAHNVSREEFARGITFPDIMQRNLENLRQGLRCR